MTKYRDFELKKDILQKDYVAFRTGLETHRPSVWENLNDLPEEMFYDILVRSAITGGWIEDVVEKNEYDEETTWEWNLEYVDNIKASGGSPITSWGDKVFNRWVEIKTLDPN